MWLTEQEISGAEAGESDVSVPAEIALPPTCLAAQLQVPIIVDGNSSQQAPSLSSSHQDCQLGLPNKAAATQRSNECACSCFDIDSTFKFQIQLASLN